MEKAEARGRPPRHEIGIAASALRNPQFQRSPLGHSALWNRQSAVRNYFSRSCTAVQIFFSITSSVLVPSTTTNRSGMPLASTR